MPMYEFYCSFCNTIFTFLSKSINTDKKPSCPRCKRDSLSRMVSRFAVTGSSKNKSEEDGDNASDIGFDEAKMEKAMEVLAAEAENMHDDDPRQAAQLMRKLTSMTGLQLGDKMEEAISRLEAGEDPDSLEQHMGEMNENDLFKLNEKKAGRKSPPARDDTLYDM